MTAYPRAELDEMVRRWLAANEAGESSGNWRHLADYYTEDASYGWNLGPTEEFMVVGRDDIREIAVGLEMAGLQGWTYPYVRVLVDDQAGEVVGFWRQIADVLRDDGSHCEVAGIGGSWFGYGGNFQWAWQRDFFDAGNAGALFIQMIRDGTLSQGMQNRMAKMAEGLQPGHHRLGNAPAPLWPPGSVSP